MSKKLRDLINDSGANAFVYCDAGNGCGFGVDGQLVSYDEDADEKYGDIDLAELQLEHKTDSGLAYNYESDWVIDGGGDNPYRFKIKF